MTDRPGPDQGTGRPEPSPNRSPRHPVTRHFLGWDAPALEASAHHLLPPEAPTSEPLDLSETLIVVPGSRAGRLLVERLVARAESLDRALRPPEVISAGGLAERLYRPELPAPDAVLERLVWIEAVRGTDRSVLERLLPEPPRPDDEAGWDALASILLKLHRETGAEGIPFRSVAEISADGMQYSDEARWRVLARIQERALGALRSLGFMDVDEARRRAIERARAGDSLQPPGREIVLIGLSELPGVTAALLAHLPVESRVRALVHAPEGRAADFDELGCVIAGRWEGERLSIPEDVLVVVDQPGDQADAVLRAMASLDGGWSAEEITVGVPDTEVTPFLVDRLEEAGVTTRPAEGRPLERSGLFRLIEAVAGVLRTGEIEAWTALVRHPAVDGWLTSQDPELARRFPMEFDRFQRHHLQAVMTDSLPAGGEPRWESWSATVGTLRRRVVELLRTFDVGSAVARGTVTRPGSSAPGASTVRPLSRWPERLRALLLELLGPGPLRRSVDPERETLEAIRALESFLQPLETLPPEVDREVTGGEFLRFLLSSLRGGSIPPRSDTGAVELLGWLELHLDDAPVLFLTGVNEPHLPEALGADPFLPNSLRTRLGLADNRRRWARDLYRLQAILNSRKRVRLVAGRRTASGDPLRLSRLFLAEEPEVIARRILVALGEGGPVGSGTEASDDGAEPTDEAAGPDPLRIRLPPEPELRVDAPIQSLSVTGFRSFLRDPYAFGLEVYRRLEGEDDAGRELDPLGFGLLAHAVLERWGREPGADRMEETRLSEALLDLLDATAREWFGSRPLPAVRIQIEQLRTRLRAVAAAQALRNAEGWEIRAIEARPPDPGTPFPVDDEPFFLRGRIDRIDHHPGTGVWSLLDYKTSARATSPDRAHRRGRGEARRWVDLQLPLYRHLARRLEGEDGTSLIPTRDFGGSADGTVGAEGGGDEPASRISRIEMGYFLIPSELARTGVEMAEEWDPTDLAEADETARGVIREIRTGVVRWDPESSRIRQDDPLGPVTGAGTLRLPPLPRGAG